MPLLFAGTLASDLFIKHLDPFVKCRGMMNIDLRERERERDFFLLTSQQLMIQESFFLLFFDKHG